MLTLHQLAIFRAVAHHLNFSRAANELFLTQPAVSRQIQALEHQLGLALFARHGRHMQLTDAGQDVLACAQRVESLLEELESTLQAHKGLQRGRLRLSATTTAGEYLLPSLVAGFRQRFPGVAVALHVTNREGVLRALSAGDADLALMGRPPATADWAASPILPNELVAVASPGHPLLRGRPAGVDTSFELSTLRDETFFVREPGSGTRLAVEHFLDQTGWPPDNTMELGSDSAIKQVVMAGLGIAILSRQALELELSVGRLAILPLVGLPLLRHWFMVEPRRDRPPPAVQAFSRYLHEAVAQQASPA
jgi:DNA-binding transcriptional LysR family regulator